MRISLENLYVDFFEVQSALSDYVGLVLNCLIIHGLCQFTQFKIQSYDKIFKIRFCFPKRRENAGYAYTCLQVFGQYGTFLFTFLVSCSFSKSNLRGVKKLIVPKEATTTFGINTFQYLAISNWNSLPDETRRAPDLNTFVRMYKAV